MLLGFFVIISQSLPADPEPVLRSRPLKALRRVGEVSASDMTATSSLEEYRGGGDRADAEEDFDDVDDEDESRFFRQDLSTGGSNFVVLIVGSEILARAADIKRITSSSALTSGRGTPFSLGARGVLEPRDGFVFFKDIIVRS
jgi:hypothetical protein